MDLKLFFRSKREAQSASNDIVDIRKYQVSVIGTHKWKIGEASIALADLDCFLLALNL